MKLTVAGETVDVDEAHQVVRGYAFATRPAAWSRPRLGVGDDLTDLSVPIWAYRTYDCLPRGAGRRLDAVDWIAADGINGRLTGATMAAIRAVSDLVSDALESAPATPFWTLAAADVTDPPVEKQPVWWMWRAWTLLMGAKHCDVAVTHETLHHRRPDLFPLVDNKTLPVLGARRAWRHIHDDLTAGPDAWAALEDRFEADAAAVKPRGERLTRLRLHDILLQTRVAGQYDRCIAEALRLRL